MIKHINSDEINNLKVSFEEIIILKKLLVKDKLNKFVKQEINLKDAIDVFYIVNSMNIFLKEDISFIFTSILIKENIIDEKTYKSFKKCTFNYDHKYDEEEYDKKVELYDDIEDIQKDIDNIIGYICKKANIKYGSASFTDIIFDVDSVDCEFRKINECNKEIFENYYNYEDPIQEFYENFSEDATIYFFKGIKVPDRIIRLFNEKTGGNGYGGFVTELYIIEDSTYLTIADSLYNEPIDIKIILIVICSLLEGGKYVN